MSAGRLYNFSAGPATLPETVLEKARESFLNFENTGASVMEVSHRGKVFSEVAERTEATLRELMAVPDNYRVLFLPGGATLQFSSVPNNLMGQQDSADYIITGHWSKKAFDLSQRYGQMRVAADAEALGYCDIPRAEEWVLNPGAAYVHYAPNETIHGVEFHNTPEVGDVPLVADMSSNILSRPIDVSRFGVIYAGAQKNIGPSGITLLLVREDLLGHCRATWPDVQNYAAQSASGSMLNTPPTYPWYLAGLVFEWMRDQGGLAHFEVLNQRKADKLYHAIDESSLYSNAVAKHCRSRMNVPFVLADDSLTAAFLAQAEQQGLLALKGHKAVGGIRASLYNAMPEEGVDALVAFMREFERTQA